MAWKSYREDVLIGAQNLSCLSLCSWWYLFSLKANEADNCLYSSSVLLFLIYESALWLPKCPFFNSYRISIYGFPFGLYHHGGRRVSHILNSCVWRKALGEEGCAVKKVNSWNSTVVIIETGFNRDREKAVWRYFTVINWASPSSKLRKIKKSII